MSWFERYDSEPGKGATMELLRPPITRWTAELVDRGQERRFRVYNLRGQRHTAFVTLGIILLANVVTFTYSVLGDETPLTAGRTIAQAVATAIGVALVIALRRQRRHQTMLRLVTGTVLVLTALIAVLLVTGAGMGFRGAILVIGGVAVIYLTVPLNLVGVTGFAVLYSAVTIPLWLSVIPAGSDVDVRYTLMATALAHLLSFIEARRAQRERRVLFAQREALVAMSSVDPLTGLANRRGVEGDLARAWRGWQRARRPLTALMVDIDHFKRLNDTRGHTAGDQALQLVAEVLRAEVPRRAGQVAARYGGEEFLCLLPGADLAAGAEVAARILDEVRRIAVPMTVSGGSDEFLTVSIGVAAAEKSMRYADELVNAADQQLYRAKRDGRNCVRSEPFAAVGSGARDIVPVADVGYDPGVPQVRAG